MRKKPSVFRFHNDEGPINTNRIWSVLTTRGLSSKILSHPKVLALAFTEIEGGTHVWITVDPMDGAAGRIPRLYILVTFFLVKGSNKIGLFVCAGSYVTKTNPAEYESDPVVIVTRGGSRVWGEHLEPIARKFAGCLVDGISWAADLVEMEMPIPLANSWPSNAPVTVGDWQQLTFDLPEPGASVRLHDVSPNVVACSEDWRLAAWDGQRLLLLDIERRSVAAVTGDLVGPSPFWAPEGERVGAIHGSGMALDKQGTVSSGAIAEVNLLRGSARQIYYCGNRSILGANWSPDGRTIAVCLSASGKHRSRLVMVPVDGSGMISVYKEDADEELGFPFWSPGGQFVYFVRKGDRAGLWRAPAMIGKEPELVLPGNLLYPALSPDGALLAYLHNRSIDTQGGAPPDYPLELMQVETGHVTQITMSSGGLSWSPDGRYLFFVHQGLWMYGVMSGARAPS
jgi:hypothetical protein